MKIKIGSLVISNEPARAARRNRQALQVTAGSTVVAASPHVGLAVFLYLAGCAFLYRVVSLGQRVVV